MAMTITVELTDLEEKCMRYAAADPEEWVRNLVSSRVFAAKQDIYQSEIQRMTADPNTTSIPADVDAVVMAAEVKYANAEPELPPAPPV
jgi:hypothetical protein